MLRSRLIGEKAAIISAMRDKVWPLWAANKLRTFTYRTFPLVEAAEAVHRENLFGERFAPRLFILFL